MPAPVILINQATLIAGIAGQSRDDGVLGQLVTLTETANPSPTTIEWIVVPPPGSSVVATGTATSVCTFMPSADIDRGTYLIFIIINGVLFSYTVNPVTGQRISSQGGFAIKLPNGRRRPGRLETNQFGADGWCTAVDEVIRLQPFLQAGSSLIRPGEDKLREVKHLTDWVSDPAVSYDGLLEAIDFFRNEGGGTLILPPLGEDIHWLSQGDEPIDLDFDDFAIWIQGSSKLQHITPDESVPFFRFAGGGQNQNVHFIGGMVSAINGAGDIITFEDASGLGQAHWTSYFQQLNPRKHILYMGPTHGAAGGGMFTNIFAGRQWQHGNGSIPGGPDAPQVPAVYIKVDGNVFNENTFEMQRTNSHHGSCPFFWFESLVDGAGPYWTKNRVDVRTVEQATFGYVYIAGHRGFIFRGGVYDLDGTYGHLVETATGPVVGGRHCEEGFFDIDVVSVDINPKQVGSVISAPKSCTITRSGSTATVLCTGHGYVTGDKVFHAGADQTAYDDMFTVTRIDADHYTVPVSGSPATPATGTIWSFTMARKCTITSVGTLATVALTAHGFGEGQRVYVEGAVETDYNSRHTASVIDADHFTYEMDADPTSPATGTIQVGVAAMSLKFGPDDANHIINRLCGNAGSRASADHNNRSCEARGATSTGHHYRVDTEQSSINEIGTEDPGFTAPRLTATLLLESPVAEIDEVGSNTGDPVLFPDGLVASEIATIVATDGPLAVAVPETVYQWLARQLPSPDAFGLMQSTSGDEPDVLGENDLTVDVGVSRGQTVSGWTGKSMLFHEGVNGEGLIFGSSVFDPSLDAVAALIIAQITNVTATRVAIILGINSTGGSAGAQILRFTAAGLMNIVTDGGSASGTFNYEADGLFHPFLLCTSKRRSRIVALSDKEFLEGLWNSHIVNGNLKGIGGAGSVAPPAMYVREWAWWYGDKAEEIFELATRVPARLGWPVIATPADKQLPRDGLAVTRTGAGAISIAVGWARDDSDTHDIKVLKALTVDFAASGLDTGAEAPSTWYGVWLFDDSNGVNVPFAKFSVSTTGAPTYPTGYDRKRLIFWVRNDSGSDLLHWLTTGNGRTQRVMWDEARSVLLALNAQGGISFAQLDLSALTPPGCRNAYIQTALVAPTVGGALTDVLEIQPNGANASDGQLFSAAVLDAPAYSQSWMGLDASRILKWKTTDVDDDASIWVRGYEVEL